jgi:Carboxypeptidase regulatory-like domain/TonB-dependent Receptor Plug Domain/TonB dependent receptor
MCPRSILVLRLGLVALVGLVVPAAAVAQSGLATVTGIVSDETGGAVPGLTVTATNQATNVAYTGLTNDAGNYIMTAVPIGTYIITVEMQGFKGAQSTVTLSAAQTARVDFKLQIGTVTERVEVTATGAVLQTENAVVGSKLERDQIEKLPTQGRNLLTATLYTAGVTTPNPSSFNSLKNTGGGRPFVNGQREQANNFTLDGVDMNDAIDNLLAYQPSPDAVEQVSVETNNYSAELGNVAGAIVNMVVKSGTNRFMGNGFYYWRDNKLAATPWATNRAGGVKSQFSRNIGGGTLGGPIVRNKLFFFGDFQAGRQKSPPADSFTTVAPDEWRRGDLSSLLSAATPIVVRDPLTGQPFPNNQIPVGRFSTFARNLFANESLYPRPNVSRALSDFRQNYRGKSASEEESNQFDVKMDWNASANDKLYVRYSKQTHEARPIETVMPLVFSAASENPFWSTAANWNRIIGRSLVNDLLVGFNDNGFNSQPLDIRGVGNLNNQLGIAGAQPLPGLTEVRLGNNLANVGTTAIKSNTANEVFQVNERLTWIRGRHLLKFGGSWNHYTMQRFYGGNNGVLGFISYTAATFTGANFGDFLLDQVSQKGRGSLAEPWTQYQHRVGMYAADDFKATNNLTLNLGLRWEYTSPLVEKDDRQANIDLTNATLRLAGQDGNSRALYNAYYKGWEPRLGFAYSKGDRWVFRGAYGITQYMEGTGANLRLPLNPPFFFESDVRYDATSGASTIATGFEGLQAPSGLSGQPRAWDPNLRPQFTQQWNVFAEYLLGSRSSLNLGYVGSKSDHLVTPVDGNQPLPGVGDPGTWLPVQQRRPLYPFNPNITSISTTASRGRANYNALQTTFKQRMWQGVDFVANYTWSKAMSNNLGYYGSGGVAAEGAYPMNSYNIEANYGPAFFDATHNFSLAGSYDLPFGKERQIGANWNRALDAIAGGWAMSFAVTAHSGFPITVTDGAGQSLQASRSPERPNRIASGEVDNPTLERWIDRAAFVTAPRGQFGDSGVGILRAPGYWNIDMSFSKRIMTFGRQYFMFRGEIFNALNHPNFGPPVANIQSQTFGSITSTVGDARVVQLVAKYSF